MKNKNIKICSYCNGQGHREITVYYPISKMKKIMKKHKFTQLALSELLGITQTSVNNWVKPSANVRGVKKKYFDILSEKGFD